ncbi:MAG: hypothetical protein ACRBDL_05580 [Alphaproteobacteria bacterium]
MVGIIKRSIYANIIGLCLGVVFVPFVSGLSYAKDASVIAAFEKAHIHSVNKQCVGQWEKQICMKALSEASMAMASKYAERLNQSGNGNQMEPLKQGCAASTAAMKVNVPAYAMKSALTECANTVSDVVDTTGVQPDINLYQILIAGVLCIGKDQQCAMLEAQFAILSQQ